MNEKILQEVAEATSLREGIAGVEALLRAVHRNESGRLADAAREARLPLPVATAVRRELEKRGMLMRQHGLAFTPDGEQWVREKLGFGALLTIDVPLTPKAPLGSGTVCRRDIGSARGAALSVGCVGGPARRHFGR